jgi:L-fuculose-phosphate aldolase
VGSIPFADQLRDGAGAAATAVAPDHPVAMLRHNGALVAGRGVLDAFDRLEVLEATAGAIIRGRVLGPIKPMPEAVIRELLEAFPGV